MSEKVIITRSKLDDLANVIGGKTDVGVPLTLDQMSSEVGKLTHKPLLLSLSNINTGAPVQGAYTPTSIDTTDYITTDTMYYIIVEGTTTCTRTSTVDSFYYEGPFTTPSNTTDVVTIPLSTVQVISGSGSAHSQSIRLGVSKVNIIYVSDQGASTCTSNLSISYYPVKNITTNGEHDVKDYYAANVDVQGEAKELVVTPGANEQVFSIYDEQDEENLKIQNQNSTIAITCLNNEWYTHNSFNFDNILDKSEIVFSGILNVQDTNTVVIDTETVTDVYFEFNKGQGTLITEKFMISIRSPNQLKIRYIGQQDCFKIQWNIIKLKKIQNYDYYNPVTVNPPEDVLEKFVKRDSSITSFYNSSYSVIGPGAFAGFSQLSRVDISNCTIIEPYAFYACNNLTYIDARNCTSIGEFAFYSCSLYNAFFPSCVTLSTSTFAYCKSLTSISLPNCSTIGTSAFYYCSYLTSLNLPKCQTCFTYAFANCRRLSTISLPICSNIGSYAFYNCSELVSIYLPEVTYLSNNIFNSCFDLSTISLPKCSYISASCFFKCYNLLSLYLMSTSVVKLSYSTAFNSTPISTYTTSTNGVYGSIYVPASLLTQYQSATNWTYYSSRLVGI